MFARLNLNKAKLSLDVITKIKLSSKQPTTYTGNHLRESVGFLFCLQTDVTNIIPQKIFKFHAKIHK